MADYTRASRRFTYRGIQLVPQDALQEGKVAFIQNMRSRQEETLTVRYGYDLITVPTEGSGDLGAPIHSIFRLNDTTPYADTGAPSRRFVGAGATLFGGTPGGAVYTPVLAGFSGNPLTGVTAAPRDSPRPWLYVADSAQLRKVNSDFEDQPIGIGQPNTPPTALFQAIETTNGHPINTPGWVSYGVSAIPTVIVLRLGAVGFLTITAILYDSGVTGMATVALSDMTGIVQGTTVDVDSLPSVVDKVIVQEVHPAVGPTTIGGIVYDAGTTGLCTIQPTGSLFTGQIESIIPNEVRRRYEALGQPVPSRVTVNRVVDYAVNAMVLLGGVEFVRIQSVAIGNDGTLSFRAFTNNSFSAGASIAGVSSFRASFTTTKTAGTSCVAFARQNTITPATTDPVVGGIQTATTITWEKVGTKATSQDDIIRFGFRASQFGYVQAVRLMINVSDDDGGGGATFLQNYYMYEWRASDLLSAIQIVAGDSTALMAEAQAAAVTTGQSDAAYGTQYGQQTSGGPLNTAGAPTGTTRLADGSVVGSFLDVRKGNASVVGRTPTDSFVSTGATPSRQLSIGDNQWVWLQCRVGDLTRIGTDASKSLQTINAFALTVQIGGTTDLQTVEFGDLYVTGGYGVDAGQTLPPYVYRYRYRSTVNGERSNPSPTMRGGIAPQRGAVNLTGIQSGAPQCDVVDWFRYGGSLARWSYVGTGQNSATPAFQDTMQDQQIDGGETLDDDIYQPWPVFDLPRTGTCNVAGTALTFVSGDAFNPEWAAGSTVIINGRATSLYQSPTSTTRMQVVDNCGLASGASFSIPGATILAQPLPYMWGGPIDDVWFNFACGDPSDGSLLHWTRGNDPDATSPANTVVGTSASEPLMNGFFDDGIPYVFSSNQLYRIVPTFGNLSTFEIVATKCTKGLWAPWAFTVLPNGGGVIFLTGDGLYLSQGGGEAESIIDPDLRVLFPQDGSVPEAIRGLFPIDFTQTTRLRLATVDAYVYFDYVDTNGSDRTLVYEPLYKRWTPDVYAVGITTRLSEPGPQVFDDILGGVDGNLYLSNADQLTDAGITIPWEVDTEWVGGDNPREVKQWGDAILDVNPGSSTDGILVTPVTNNGNLPATTVGIAGIVRDTFVIEVDAGDGVLSRNFGLNISGGCQICDGNRPLLYLWEPSFLLKNVEAQRRVTDWDDLGYVGAKFIQGIVLRANTYDQDKALIVEADNAAQLTFTAHHNGENQVAYPRATTGWDPFIAELVRLRGGDDTPWTLLNARWVWEPAPELATQWETQDTTFDFPGYLSVFDAVIAYSSDDVITLRVWHDDAFEDYTLPLSSGAYVRQHVIFQTRKGLSAKFQLTSLLPFRLYMKDCSVRVQAWGVGGSYTIQRPFGGPSREVGATV